MSERFLLTDLKRASDLLCSVASTYPSLNLEQEQEAPTHAELLDEAGSQWSEETWRAASLAAAMQGISEILDHVLSINHLGDVPTSFRKRIRDQARLNAERVTLQRQECIELVQAAAEQGIETIVLKGMVAAHTLYKDPRHRPMADADLLVHQRELIPAVRAMTGAGFRVVARTPKHVVICPIDNEAYPHIWSDHPENRRSVEIHDALYYEPLKVRVRMPDAVWNRRQPLVLGGHSVQRLGDVDAAILCALDVAESLFSRTLRFVKIVDLALLVSRFEDPDLLAYSIEQQGKRVAGCAFLAFSLAERAFRNQFCREISNRLSSHVSRTLRQGFEKMPLSEFSYINPVPTFLGRFEGLRLASGFGDRMSVLKNLVVPEREWRGGEYYESGHRPWVKHYVELLGKMRNKTMKELDPKLKPRVLEVDGFE